MTKKFGNDILNRPTEISRTSGLENLHPRSITGAVMDGFRKKEAGGPSSQSATYTDSPSGGGMSNIYRNSPRRFYDPEQTNTAVHLPKGLKQKNRWYRWFYNHDEVTGAVIELHATLPYSKFELELDDPFIKSRYEACVDKTNLFSKFTPVDTEFMLTGESIIHHNWDESSGMWDNVVILDPDYVEVVSSPFIKNGYHIELRPDEELRKLVNSSKPEQIALKKRLPKEILKKVSTGKNIELDPDTVTHIARKTKPTDVRGTSMLSRMLRSYMYEDKLREAQITIADNFIFPLKIFKLGDKNLGWVPNESHQQALAQMLQQASFDPNFALIYHYGLEVDYVTVADKLMNLNAEWDELTKRKMIGLGVSQSFLNQETSYAAANAGLQVQLSRYKAKRDMLEDMWIIPSIFQEMARRNEWYKRDKREIVGQYRVARSDDENQRRLIIPRIVWNKKLSMRDDNAYLTFLNNVYAQGKGPISTITLLQHMGLDLEHELVKKRNQREMEVKIGEKIHSTGVTPGAGLGAPAPRPASFLSKLFGRKKEASDNTEVPETPDEYFTKGVEKTELRPKGSHEEEVEETAKTLLSYFNPVSDSVWSKNTQSVFVSSEVRLKFLDLNSKVLALYKKSSGNIKTACLDIETAMGVSDIYKDLYKLGKYSAYGVTGYRKDLYDNFVDIEENIVDYTDLVLFETFESWILKTASYDISDDTYMKLLRNIGNSCFSYGQLKGYLEQGFEKVALYNSYTSDGVNYDINDLLKKEFNLAPECSNTDEILIFFPNTSEYDNTEYKLPLKLDRKISGILLKDCPAEYYPMMDVLLTKTGSVIKKRFSEIIFVGDISKLPEWQKDIRDKFATTVVDEDGKDLLINSYVSNESAKNSGILKSFKSGKKLYVANNLNDFEIPVNKLLVEVLDIPGDVLDKKLAEKLTPDSYDLTDKELRQYELEGVVEPVICGTSDNSKYFKLSSELSDDYLETLPDKLVKSAAWDSQGQSFIKDKRTASEIFEENIFNYVFYSHHLDENLKSIFDEVFK